LGSLLLTLNHQHLIGYGPHSRAVRIFYETAGINQVTPFDVPVEAAAVGRKLGEISLGWLLT